MPNSDALASITAQLAALVAPVTDAEVRAALAAHDDAFHATIRETDSTQQAMRAAFRAALESQRAALRPAADAILAAARALAGDAERLDRAERALIAADRLMAEHLPRGEARRYAEWRREHLDARGHASLHQTTVSAALDAARGAHVAR